MGLTARPEVQHVHYLLGRILFLVPLSHRAQVGRRCLEKYHCGAVAFSIHSVTSGAIVFEHLRSGVGFRVSNGYSFE
jgi:hypothetical protein